MIKSINVWAFSPERPLAEVFAMARDNGFAGVEVAVDEQGEITPQSTEDDCRRIVDQAQSAGVQLVSLASGFGWSYPLTTSRADVARKGRECVAASLRLAKWLGTDAILVVPGAVGVDFIPDFPTEPYDTAHDNALAAFRALKPVALEHKVTMGIENVWNKFLLSPLEFRDFLDKVNDKSVGAYFDVGNVIATGYPEQWIRILRDRIVRVHLKDYKREVGTLDGFCDLLEGSVDYAAVMAALREVGYDGPLTAEYFNCEADLGKISAAIDKIMAM